MKRFRVDVGRPGLLQAVRLTHALAEATQRVHVRWRERSRYQWLQRFFRVRFRLGGELVRPLPGVHLDHATPLTAVGSIERHLIFPHAIATRCRSLWRDRDIDVFFAGQATPVREAAIRRWAELSGGDLSHVHFSSRGRVWPAKAWDQDYYSTLGRSAFTLCPDGDFIWTYRFFEAALCGSIPVIQNKSVHYDGFVYRTMEESASALQWDANAAAHNYALAAEQLTVPLEELTGEAGRLLASS